MKQPKLSNLKQNHKETKIVRSKINKNKGVKITINIDFEALSKIKILSTETGIPYQRLLNNLLQESLETKDTVETRIQRLEKEIKILKKIIAA